MNLTNIAEITDSISTDGTHSDGTDSILNNVDTPAFIFKLGAALLTTYQKFRDKTNGIAEKYLTGDGTEVYRIVHEYYAEYEAHAQERVLLEALNTMTTAIYENRERDLIRLIEDTQRSIDDMYRRIAEYSERLNTHKANYLLFKLTDEDARVQELKTFLRNSYANITGLRAERGAIHIAYKTPLVFFEPDAMQRYFDSTRTNVVNGAPNWVQQLLKDLFINRTKQLLIETGAIISIENPQINYRNPASIRTDVYAPREFSGIPNPHHHYYNCWGDNKPNILRALEEHDYVLAITQVFAAMGGLNLTDTPVMEKFIRNELREYKASFKINCATLVPTQKGIELNKSELTEIHPEDVPEEIQRGYILLEDLTPEEQKLLIERRKRQFAKFGKEYEPELKHVTLDREWQKELHREIIEEIRY